MGELIFLGLLALVVGSMYFPTLNFEQAAMDKTGGPEMFPRAVIAFTLVFIIIRIISVLRTKEKPKFMFLEFFTGMKLFFYISLVVYVIMLQSVGYIISTILFAVVVVNTFYYKTKGNFGSVLSIVLRNVGFIVLILGLYYFFAETLNITLPEGILTGIL